jgi:acyl-CoA dehydrogenase
MLRDRFIQELPFFTNEHRSLAARVAEFAARQLAPRASEDDDPDEQLRAGIALLAQADLLRYTVIRADVRPDVRAMCVIREALAYYSPLVDLAFMMQGLGTYALSLAAPDHVRDFWLARAATGKAIAAFALTEPDAGSDVSSIQTTAERDANTYLINGRKCLISNAGVADFYTVFARTGTEPDGNAQISAFVVSARLPGFTVRARHQWLSSYPMGEIEFNALRVPAEDMIGAEGEGLYLAMQTLDLFRASVGAAACGMARRALDETALYVERRKQFGHALADFQLVQEKLANMVTELDAARLLVYRAAHLKDTLDPRAITRETSEAKLFATEAAGRIIDNAVQLHGGNGLVRGHMVERLYRDARALRIYGGTSEIQRIVIASQLMQEYARMTEEARDNKEPGARSQESGASR